MLRTISFFGCLALLFLCTPLHADFSKPVIESVQRLQQAIIDESRNINGADAATTWELFDQDVLKTLNSGLPNINADMLNLKYGMTDITLPVTTKEDEKPIKSLSNIQVKNLLKAAKPYKSMKLRILLALGTGLRRGDIETLKISDINFEGNSITTTSKKTRKSVGLVQCLQR